MRVEYLSIVPELLVQHGDLIAHEQDVFAYILCNCCGCFMRELLAQLDITVCSVHL